MKNRYEIRGDITIIFLVTRGEVVESIIDTKDLQIAKEYPNTWFAWYSKDVKNYYVVGKVNVNGKRKNIRLHRLIMNAPESLTVDHINHNTIDNRRLNLRLATNSENAQNKRVSINNKSGVKGVHWDKPSQKWAAAISADGIRTFLGNFDSVSEAEKTIIEARSLFQPYSPEAKSVKPIKNKDEFGPQHNKSYNNSLSKVRGVHWNKFHSKWSVAISKNKKQIHLGYYETIEEAQNVYLEAKGKDIKELDYDGKPASSNKTSGIKNVSYSKKDKVWIVQICRNKKRVHIGSYKTLEEAALVAEQARNKLTDYM